MREIIVNQIRTPDGTILTSHSVHDYKTHLDKNGEIYMVDGGSDYQRRNVCSEPHEELSLYTDDSHTEIRERWGWGTYGKDGNSPFKRVMLKDMTTNHINAIIETQKHISGKVKNLFENELKFRGLSRKK